MSRRAKRLIGVVALALIAFIGIKAFQVQIGTAMLKRAVAERAGRDITASLPDGLHIGLCGTGSPLPSPTRAGPCNVVIAGKHVFVVDAGEHSAPNISMMGIPNGKIEAVFLTHFHSDHIDGMGPMMMLRWTGASAKSPLPIYGGEGVEKIVDGFNTAYGADFGYRTAHHGEALVPVEGAGGVAKPFAVPDSGSVLVYEGDGLKVTAFRVDHGPIHPAVGYRFDYQGRSAVISGDTVKTASVIAAAKGVDLLVHEALQPKLLKLLTAGLEEKGVKNTAQLTRDIVNYHTMPEGAADVAKAAGVKQLVLSHIVPSVPNKFFYPAFLGDAAKHYGGRIVVGEDGMLFSLPAGSTNIKQTRVMK